MWGLGQECRREWLALSGQMDGKERPSTGVTAAHAHLRKICALGSDQAARDVPFLSAGNWRLRLLSASSFITLLLSARPRMPYLTEQYR